MSSESENKRIDFRFINSGISPRGIDLLVDEIKRCYQLIDDQKSELRSLQACAECSGHREELECTAVCECSDGFKDASE